VHPWYALICIKSRLVRRQPAYPGKVDAFRGDAAGQRQRKGASHLACSDSQFHSGAAMTPNESVLSPDATQWLPGFRLTHVFRLASNANLNLTGQVAAQFDEVHARVHNWAMIRRGDVLDHKIVVDDISEGCARALRDRLVALDGELRVQVEHLFSKQT
jgi:hypothetical protein